MDPACWSRAIQCAFGRNSLGEAYHSSLKFKLPLNYKGLVLEVGYRLDLLVGRQVVVEVKAVEALAPVHKAQLLTYMRLASMKVGLLVNFHVPVLRQGIRRVILSSMTAGIVQQSPAL